MPGFPAIGAGTTAGTGFQEDGSTLPTATPDGSPVIGEGTEAVMCGLGGIGGKGFSCCGIFNQNYII